MENFNLLPLLSVQLMIALMLICCNRFPVVSCVNLKKLFKPENEQVLRIMKEELDQFRIDMTKSFMRAHSRQKRAQAGHVNDIKINDDQILEDLEVEPVGPFSTFTFAGKHFLIKRDGIYHLNSLNTFAEGNPISKEISLVENGAWRLSRKEVVLNGFEWKRNFFLVTTTGNFSTIYTLHETSLQPVFRQNIHNKANAVGAEFFDYRRNLYMIILNDNEMHATTFSPIFRWAGSYMDEIHQVQTTGASAVKTFTINSKNYIAIAQSLDSAGNTQVGTQVLSMDHMDRLERVQLLWSNGARNLNYMQTEREHFLVIGQEKEPSIVYWFGGMDFIFWQQFDKLQGKDLVIESIQLTADEPILLTTDSDLLKIFSRSASPTKIMTTWVETNKSLDDFNTKLMTSDSNVKITNLNILRSPGNKDIAFVAITTKTPGSTMDSLKIYPVNFVKTELSVSRTKEGGDTLSQCLQTLRASLEDSEENLKRVEEASRMVLTVDGNWDFEGEIEATKVIKTASSKVANAEISPSTARLSPEDRIGTAPSKLMDNIKTTNDKLEGMKSQLDNLFYKSKRPNSVAGNLRFLEKVNFNQVNAADNTNLRFETINDVTWENLDNFALKTSSEDPQQVITQWTVNSIKSDSLETTNPISKLSASNFMTKSCTDSQSVSGVNQFNREVKISKEINLESVTTINGIPFSDVVLKENSDSSREIRGIKHAPEVKGNYNVEFLNHENLHQWFAGVARISGTEEQQFTGLVEIRKDAPLHIDNLEVVDEMNSRNWNHFQSSVMLDGENQQVEGLFTAEALRADNIQSKTISGIASDELLTSRGNQDVTSQFTVDHVEIDGPLSTDSINGIRLSDAVNQKDEQVEINGFVTLENFEVQDVTLPENVKIAGKDVSEISTLRKVHKYSTANNGPIFFKQVNVGRIETEHIDDERVDDFSTKYWSKSGDNVANPAQLILDTRKVFVSEGDFKTGKLNLFSFPDEFVSLDRDEIFLLAPLNFRHPVIATADVTMAEGAKIQGIDMSKAKSMIVDDNFVGVVRGVKTFALPVAAIHGARVDMLNGIDPRNDVVMRMSNENQQIDGVLKFEKNVRADHFSVEEGNVHVTGLVNEVKLDEVKQTTAYRDAANKIEGELIFDKGVTVNKFSSTHINNMNIREITDNMIFLNSPEIQAIEGHVILNNGGAEFLQDSAASFINGVHLQEYLSQVVRLDSSGPQVITGTKTFMDATLNDRLMCTTFNNVDLQDLERNAFSKTKVQEITGKWSLKNVNAKENLQTSDIQGISLDNIVFTNEDVDISSQVAFTSRQTSIKGPVSVTGTLNGITFDEKMRDSMPISGLKNFDQVIVDGNVDWTNGQPELQRLSYLFENAVTKSGPQKITGDVTFSRGFHSSEMHSPGKWLGDVDLKQIQDDAVLRNDKDVVISGSNEFTKPIKIQNLVNPVKNLDTDHVNGINLNSMSDDIVQTNDLSDGRAIKGRKQLRSGVRARNLKVEDKISDVSAKDLVLADSDTEVGQVSFKELKIEEDIEPESTEGIDLKSFLDDRVSLKTPDQQLLGDYSFQHVKVESENGCKVPEINDVTVSNILKKSELDKVSKISGKKTFRNLAIEGKLETNSLNNHPISDLVDSTLRTDRVEKIMRPVIFEAPVTVNQQLEVESINDIHLEQFSTQVSDRISRLVSDAESPETLINQLNVQASKLQQVTQERPVWLEYLRLKKDLTGLGLGAQSRVDQVQVMRSGDILVTLHREIAAQENGLPKGCNCNTVLALNLNDLDKKNADSKINSFETENCLNVFNVISPNQRNYMVISDTSSSNTSCVTQEMRTTKIFQGASRDPISDTNLGHISDVGVFSDRDTDFLVLAQYFDKNKQSHSTITRVMRVDVEGNVENVQNIDTHGARKVAISKVNDVWMLAIANSKSSTDESSCNADSAVYTWSRESDQFILMKTIMTDGAFDVEFITTETSNEFYKQSFVAFAQEGNSASGEVMIFRFEQPGGNFVMSQTIRSSWPVTGLRSVCMCTQCFLVTVVPQEGITFYENRFVEGFQEYYKAPVFGASDIRGFKLGEEHLFAIATNKGPILAEAVLAGSCPN